MVGWGEGREGGQAIIWHRLVRPLQNQIHKVEVYSKSTGLYKIKLRG